MQYQQQRISTTQEYKYTSQTKSARTNTPKTHHSPYEFSLDSIRSPQENRSSKLTPEISQFLMACEIERLSAENEKLKFRIKEMQDNAQDKYHLELQIIDLTHRLNDMSKIIEIQKYDKSELIMQTTTLQKEIQHQKQQQTDFYESRISNLLNEVDNLTTQLREFDTLKFDEIQILRNELEFAMKTEIEKKKQKQELNSQIQREFLEGELKKWKEMCNQKQSENDDLKNTIFQKELSKQRELEHQLLSYKNETERMNKVLVSKQEDIEIWKQKYLKLQNINEDYKKLQIENQQFLDKFKAQEERNTLLTSQLNQYRQQIENANALILAEKNKTSQIFTQLAETDKKKSEFENRYKNLLLEVDKLNEINKTKEQLAITQNIKIEEFQHSLIQYRSLNEEKAQEVDTLRKFIIQLQQQIVQLEEQIDQLKRFQENCRVLSIEIDRLNEENKAQDLELRQWRMQYADQGFLIKKLQDQLCVIVVLVSEIESLRSRLLEKDLEVEDARRSSLAPYKM
ncbi:unnamed protein product (macronuclear) [Paramecium tetraurelia]|uniref:Uncharacterized protein n=1 Tax=Paramecium tetraurelia TaxID=5888 RepID=A0E183_PARTE|nr:uncharacterized protein GSPATT00022219001 [Paramecium tetraurelia]CAK89050.1 unnamed protein product [Paramecium tetraurelia]|eukprot:XP_001456447.1 hypothetical protein (macronuclear) [Paramecium tetraurelia strain d4-2]